MGKPQVLIITGPTATGKSDLAVYLAKKLNGEIISADSRQVYKYLNIGTGKITKKEMSGIPHHLLSIVSPSDQFTASEYAKRASLAIEKILSKGKLPIVVGGTGFYIDALTCRAQFPDVPPNKELRERLSKLSAGKLLEMLKKKDPERAKTVDPHNKVRLIRALEIISILGNVPAYKPVKPSYKFIYIGLKPDDLDQKIKNRLLKRLPEMIREAKTLLKQSKLSYKRMHELGLEYRFLAMYLQGEITKEEMINKLYTAIRQYAKRQMTWLKRNRAIKWFGPEDKKGILNMIR